MEAAPHPGCGTARARAVHAALERQHARVCEGVEHHKRHTAVHA